MKLPDVNVWLALILEGHSHHAAAKKWLDDQNTEDGIRFCRATQHGLVRLLTTKAVFVPYGIEPLTNERAWDVWQKLLTDERVAFADEPPGIEERWISWVLVGTASPKLWMDAWLAAFAFQSGFQLITIDNGFRQFRNLDLCLVRK